MEKTSAVQENKVPSLHSYLLDGVKEEVAVEGLHPVTYNETVERKWVQVSWDLEHKNTKTLMNRRWRCMWHKRERDFREASGSLLGGEFPSSLLSVC